MTRFHIDAQSVEQTTIYELRDSHTGAFARIWPGFGNNCLAARLPAEDGRLVDLLLSPQTLDTLRHHPSRYGIPLLFPWPGRIPQGRYCFEGQDHYLPTSAPSNSAIHGFVKDRAWSVDQTLCDTEGASLTCSISSNDYPETLEGFPFPYRLSVTYRLSATGLSMHVQVENPGKSMLPFGFGAHPYYRAPLGETSSRSQCTIRVASNQQWNLPKVGAFTPDNAAQDSRLLEEAFGGEIDLRQPTALGRRQFDNVLTAPEAKDGWFDCVLSDPQAKLEALMRATHNFTCMVIFTPAEEPGLCFEPWTCPPNVFNLASHGVEQGNLLKLAPGGVWQATMQMLVRTHKG